jgi:trehalose synthase
MRSLEDYSDIVGEEVISGIYKKARSLYGKRVLMINSTYYGGGVAEILNTFVPLMNDIGLRMGWRILRGTPDFFDITKRFHNALQGESINLSEMKKNLYVEANQAFSTYTHIDHDCVIIHDPQPLPLIRFYAKRQPWIWRCHVDLSNPNTEFWNYIKRFTLRYDMVVISSSKYRREDLPVFQRVIHPAIDPLSPKNMELKKGVITKSLKRFKIPTDKPIIAQVGRFDKWKGCEAALEVYERVRKEIDCRLVLCGSMATDDPEGQAVYEGVFRKANHLVRSGDVILITSENNIFVNALQRVSSVVLQMSSREGFGLTVTEALWKGKPVVASNVGGIPSQIADGETGFLLDPEDVDGFVEKTLYVLNNPGPAADLGRAGTECVRENFLITRLLSDYLDLLNDVMT